MALGILAGVFAFGAYRMVVAVGMRVSATVARKPHPISLLLLRVFSLGRPSERLFSVLQKVWLRQGSIAMIAGPDLAPRTLEPHKIVQFILGKLQQQFVGDSTQLDERVRKMDRTALLDGRYRVNEFYCHVNAWQPVMQRLVKESDVVLMDLRSFSKENQGCIYELGHLIDIIDLRRILFVIDPSTDRTLLEETLKQVWHQSRSDSPNRLLLAPTATLFFCEEAAERVLDSLLHQLLTFSQGQQPAQNFTRSDQGKILITPVAGSDQGNLLI